MKVPVYQNRVSVQTPQVSFIQTPSAPRQAFGEQIGKEIARTGEIIQDMGTKLGSHLLKLHEEKVAARVADLDTSFRKDINDKLINPEEETINVNGQDVTRPKGIMVRSLNQTEGAYQEFSDFYASKRDEYLGMVDDKKGRQALAQKLDGQFLTYQMQVRGHEATQIRKARIDSQASNLAAQVKDAAGIIDSRSLENAIINVAETQDNINSLTGVDEVTGHLNKSRAIGEVVENSVISTVYRTGDLELAHALLDKAKDYITPGKYQELLMSSQDAHEKYKKYALKAFEDNQDKNESQLILDMANKNVSVLTPAEVIQKVQSGDISNEFGNAYIRVLKSPKHIDPKKSIERSGFTEYAKQLFSANDRDSAKSAIVNMLNGASEGKLNEEQLAVLLKVANKAGDKKIAGAMGRLEETAQKLGTDTGGILYKFVSLLNGGRGVDEAKQDAIESERIQANPESAKYSYGDEVTTPLGIMYVWGYYDDGEPDVRKTRPPKQ